MVMAGPCLGGYWFGAVIRYNIAALARPGLHRDVWQVRLERMASWSLAFAYIVSGGRVLGGRGSRERGRPARLFRSDYAPLEQITILCRPSTSGALRLTLRTNGLPFVLSVAERSRSMNAGSRPAGRERNGRATA